LRVKPMELDICCSSRFYVGGSESGLML
jgi:hypothetical protein